MFAKYVCTGVLNILENGTSIVLFITPHDTIRLHSSLIKTSRYFLFYETNACIVMQDYHLNVIDLSQRELTHFLG